ncbi:M48 family metallopeptidase [Mucilaginibacter agri]|uniref:M48 family metalloprotease n=1 Tax=Mucilaginibacter agri TaxID=2695265 RepID=A0A965ZHU1_9SPHI|nr:M48 family metallopeptidase [Mucilaginibacter agri]NCD70244.1 M48 family metalloprotease [Mucilaginibacter agri]
MAIIERKNKELERKYNERGFLFDNQAWPYLQSIIDHIIRENHLDKSHYHFFVDRSSVVNAYSYEDGTVVCNLGLVSIVENESQLAMVLCHELGHCILNHVNTAILKQLSKLSSPELLRQIKAIQKNGYNQKEKLESLMLNTIFDERRHDREQEKAADSLAMILFSHTEYNGQNVSGIFDLLDSADKNVAAINISTFFKRESIDLDAELSPPDKPLGFGNQLSKERSDSLQTHPDCAQRKVWMQNFFAQSPKSGKDYLFANNSQLNEIKKMACLNAALYSKDQNHLSMYLFQLIQASAYYPQNAFITAELFTTMVSLSKHMKAHTLHQVAENQYNTDDKNDQYTTLLKLLDNLSSWQMADIATRYFNNNKLLINASTEALNTINNH